MRSFDPAIILELEKEGFSFHLLAKLELASGTFRHTDADVDLYYNGEKYDSRDFIFDRVETSGDMGVDTLGVTYNNAVLSMGAIVLSEDIMGRNYELSFIVTSTSGGGVLTETGAALLLEDGGDMLLEVGDTIGPYTIIGGHSLFYGLVSDWKIEEDKVWIEIQNELVFWSKKTLRKCDSSCPWEFGGTDCKYAGGATWCNQSYERCQELDNTDNFGGFRFLPDIAEKDIWWGKSKD